MKRRNTMTAAVFLLAVAAGFLLLATSFFGGERDVMAFVDGAETAVNGDLDRDHLFIQLYGGVQRLSGRRVVEDAVGENTVVRLSTGGLNFVDLQAAPGVGPQVAENAAATAAFSQDLEALGIPYLYVNAPQKLQRGEALLPTGVEEYGNESADAFLAELERQGTDYVDLRPLFEENGIYSNWFFRTDHHWKPEAAFFAWQAGGAVRPGRRPGPHRSGQLGYPGAGALLPGQPGQAGGLPLRRGGRHHALYPKIRFRADLFLPRLRLYPHRPL